MDGSVGPLTVKRLAGALGAEIGGIDLAAEVSDAMVARLRALWLHHQVIFFRDQNLDPAAFLAFAGRFGAVQAYPFLRGLPDYPLITPILKLPAETVNFGGVWHSDTACLQCPPMATMLIARELPPQGGDTEFASGYAAYDALSNGVKRLLAGQKALNSSALADVSRTREDRLREGRRDDTPDLYEAEHPVARTHPETGRKSLYVSPAHASRFARMTAAESRGLLAYLFAHQVRPEFTCRFRWEPGSIAFWDNRCTLHHPINDYPGYRRLLHRVTLAGDEPV